MSTTAEIASAWWDQLVTELADAQPHTGFECDEADIDTAVRWVDDEAIHDGLTLVDVVEAGMSVADLRDLAGGIAGPARVAAMSKLCAIYVNAIRKEVLAKLKSDVTDFADKRSFYVRDPRDDGDYEHDRRLDLNAEKDA